MPRWFQVTASAISQTASSVLAAGKLTNGRSVAKTKLNVFQAGQKSGERQQISQSTGQFDSMLAGLE
jgi:hypothetical protein